jgi:hypothetical protein
MAGFERGKLHIFLRAWAGRYATRLRRGYGGVRKSCEEGRKERGVRGACRRIACIIPLSQH